MRRLLALTLVVGGASAAVAGPRPEPGMDYVIVEPQRYRSAGTAHLIYLNRCAAGCTIRRDTDDSFVDGSTIPESAGPLTPFMFGDAAWDQVVACVRQSYAAYNVQITTDPPAPGTDHVEVMVAGTPSEVGLDTNILGIAPLTNDCSTQRNVIAFAFANAHAGGDVIDICATAAHEAGHIYGLDHEFLCKDPMTYLVDCGQKHFLNLQVPCGEFDGPRTCKCSGETQDSFRKLIDELGVGTLPGPPQVEIQYPLGGAVIGAGEMVFINTVEPRVVIRTELWINGWRWGDGFGTPDQALFQIAIPPQVPDGILDIEAHAINDVGAEGVARATVTKGAPCADASTCIAGQSCDAGKCVFPTPAGELGDECETDFDCASTRCLSDGTNHLCTDDCLIGFADCPSGFTCLQSTSPTSGACWPDDLIGGPKAGCCQAGNDAAPGMIVLALGVVVILRRRRR